MTPPAEFLLTPRELMTKHPEDEIQHCAGESQYRQTQDSPEDYRLSSARMARETMLTLTR